MIPALAVLLVLLATVSLPVPREHLRGLLFGPREKHIAVLPFDNASADPLAAGLMDSMTAALSNLDTSQRSLWVIPASVVRSDNVIDPVSAYKQLGATLVVKGRLERTGQRVVIDINLINAETLRQIGAVTASNDSGDLAAAEADAVMQLGRLLNVSGARDAVARSGSSNVPAAFDLYLEALSYLQRFPIDILKIAKPFVDDVTEASAPGGANRRACVPCAVGRRGRLAAGRPNFGRIQRVCRDAGERV